MHLFTQNTTNLQNLVDQELDMFRLRGSAHIGGTDGTRIGMILMTQDV